RYAIAHNKYCECVGRAHKSNGIFFEVNVSGRELRQGCWDADCRSYPFPIHTVSPHVLPLSPEEVDRLVIATYGDQQGRTHPS
ncbi:hypothetical protein EON65_29840, partial [archaeon]